MVSGSISPPCSGYFSPFPHGTGSLSVSEECLALADGAAGFRGDSTGPHLLRVPKQATKIPVRGSHPLWPAFPCRSSLFVTLKIRPYNPQTAVTVQVWAGPRSLATTYGITFVFFSSGYLDVSVHRVCLLTDSLTSSERVAPFGFLRIKAHVRLPSDYRGLSRPSSPLRA